MLLTDARRTARTGADGELIPLAEQDRSQWDRRAIDEGIALISATLSQGVVGAYQLQAAIAALHDEAARSEDTDWPQILALYSLLKRMSDNPMVTLNHAIASAMVHGPTTGLKLIESPRCRSADDRPLPARCRPRPPAGDGRRARGRNRLLSRRGCADDQRAGAQLPGHESGSPGPLTTRATDNTDNTWPRTTAGQHGQSTVDPGRR